MVKDLMIITVIAILNLKIKAMTTIKLYVNIVTIMIIMRITILCITIIVIINFV